MTENDTLHESRAAVASWRGMIPLKVASLLLTLICMLTIAAWPPMAVGDEIKTLGFVSTISPQAAPGAYRTALLNRLRELGWVEGRNLVIVDGYTGGDQQRLPLVAKQVLSKNPDVVIAPGTQAATAVNQATRTVPIVSIMGDPVGTGLVESLARPGGNLTGVSAQNTEEIPGKWIEILRELMPRVSRVAFIVNPDNALSKRMSARLKHVAASARIKLIVLDASKTEDFPVAFERARREAQAVIVMPDPIAVGNRQAIAELARKHRLPALYGQAEFVEAGGLISYGSDIEVLWRRMADYTDKLFRGASPATLPIEQPLSFELAVNLNAARAAGLTIPESIRIRANKIAE
jgi:putative ABC transport system substrate-binding protein